jgi:hypothetical protein
MSTEGQNEYKLKFDGEANQLDAATLGYSLLNFVEIVEQTNLELETGKQIEIKVKAHEQGSFLVHFALQTGDIDNLWKLLAPDNLKLAGAIIPALIAAVTGLFKLRKHLKGEPPKEVQPINNEISLQNSNGNKIVVDKKVYNLYFNNEKVKQALSETFKALNDDPSVTGFEITDEQERPLFQASREEFVAMAITPSEPPELNRTLPIPNAILSIIKPCFERGLKWEVVYQGNKIFVAVKDEAFLTRVDNGEESFAKGDVLEAEMRIEQVFDAALNTFINKSHEIIRIKHHRPRARQMSIDLSPDSPAPKMLNPQQNES